MRKAEAEVAMWNAAAGCNVGRIKSDYDPTEDYIRRHVFDLDRPQRETTGPATNFRIRI